MQFPWTVSKYLHQKLTCIWKKFYALNWKFPRLFKISKKKFLVLARYKNSLATSPHVLSPNKIYENTRSLRISSELSSFELLRLQSTIEEAIPWANKGSISRRFGRRSGISWCNRTAGDRCPPVGYPRERRQQRRKLPKRPGGVHVRKGKLLAGDSGRKIAEVIDLQGAIYQRVAGGARGLCV